MGMYFGFRFTIGAFQLLIRFERTLWPNQPSYRLNDWILGIRLRDTAALDMLGLPAGLSLMFTAVAFAGD